MNLVLIHIGDTVPDYFWTCYKQVLKYYPGKIYVCLDEKFENRIKTLNENTVFISNQECMYSNEVYKFNSVNTLEAGFWTYTSLRLFFLEYIIKKYSLKDVFHIENDVLIYQNPLDHLKTCRKYFQNKIAVNPVGKYWVTFSYVYISNLKPMREMNEIFLNLLQSPDICKIVGPAGINEMTIARHIMDTHHEIIDYFPILPYGEWSKNLSEFGCLFDSASYGQYIGGLHHDNGEATKGWTGSHHYIGEELINKNIEIVEIEDYKYKYNVKHQGKLYPINNLHIHSKQLDKYI